MGDGLDIRGGVGGVAARTDDMRRHADLLDGTGDQLRRAASSTAAVGDPHVLLATAVYAPHTATLAQLAVADAGIRVGALALRVEIAADRLRITAAAVLAADRWPRAARQQVATTLSPVTMVLAVGGVAGGGLAGVLEVGFDTVVEATPWVDGPTGTGTGERMLAEAMENWSLLAQEAPWLVDGVVHGSTRTVDALLATNRLTRPVADRIEGREDLVVELLAIAAQYDRLVDTPIRVTAVEAPDLAPARSLVDVVAQQRALMARAAPDPQSSRIQVTEVLPTPGSTVPSSWIVLVPGTQEWPLRPGGDPADLTTNAHLSATGDAAALDAVDDAMRLAGVAPGDPVLVAGHSQGGIVAAAFSRQADARGYNVTHVFTQGSPIENLPPPLDVRVLSVEHVDDVVPRLDSGPNDDRANHTTVRADSGAPVTTNVIAPHSLDLYLRTVDEAVDSGHPSVATFDDEVTARFLRGGTVHHEYLTVRVQGDD